MSLIDHPVQTVVSATGGLELLPGLRPNHDWHLRADVLGSQAPPPKKFWELAVDSKKLEHGCMII